MSLEERILAVMRAQDPRRSMSISEIYELVNSDGGDHVFSTDLEVEVEKMISNGLLQYRMSVELG